jgi:hypothetical protein
MRTALFPGMVIPSGLISSIVLAVTISAFGQDSPGEAPIDSEELNRRNVVGGLGLPLGTVAEIEAEVIAGSSLRSKEFVSDYLLKVTQVNGTKLERPPILRFSVSGRASVKLANHTFSLYEMKHGKKASVLNSEQIAELERGYVGRKVRLVVYESGGFHGIPRNLPKGVRGGAGTAFQFSTSLAVLAERE